MKCDLCNFETNDWNKIFVTQIQDQKLYTCLKHSDSIELRKWFIEAYPYLQKLLLVEQMDQKSFNWLLEYVESSLKTVLEKAKKDKNIGIIDEKKE